jgi:hypothetical protein
MSFIFKRCRIKFFLDREKISNKNWNKLTKMAENIAFTLTCKRLYFEQYYIIHKTLLQLLRLSWIISNRIVCDLNIICLKWFINKTLWLSLIMSKYRVVSTAATADSFLVNYWPIENLVLCDYISGKEMSFSQNVTLVADRTG